MSTLEERTRMMSTEATRLKDAVDSNTSSLQEFIELGKALKIGLTILGYVEKAAVFITKLAAACALLWGLWKFAVKEAIASLLK